jgi:hypothetical protein
MPAPRFPRLPDPDLLAVLAAGGIVAAVLIYSLK